MPTVGSVAQSAVETEGEVDREDEDEEDDDKHYYDNEPGFRGQIPSQRSVDHAAGVHARESSAEDTPSVASPHDQQSNASPESRPLPLQ